MATASRDRISVDLCGMGPALDQRARTMGVSPSALVRTILAHSLGAVSERLGGLEVGIHQLSPKESRRLCLRMSGERAALLLARARSAGLNPGAYVGGLVAQIPMLAEGRSYVRCMDELRKSNVVLSTLSRDLSRLLKLLRQSDLDTARSYQAVFEHVAGDVRAHLKIAAQAVAGQMPVARSARVDRVDTLR